MSNNMTSAAKRVRGERIRSDDDNIDDETPSRTKRSKSVAATKANVEVPSDYFDSDSEQESADEDAEEEEDSNVTPREAGQINRIFVENFMCHRKFEMTFGRNLNFITGRNGSGKSAIVAAIQLCLGARSSATGRGSSLSGFVREGSQGPAICRIFIHNQGPDAFEPERFGSQICIERKIPKSGAATYAISGNVTGKFVVESNDRRVIDSMLRSYNIQIENPCSVLTQEEAKRFIQGNEKSRYQFFLRATGLDVCKQEMISSRALLDSTIQSTAKCNESVNLKKKEYKKRKDDLNLWMSLDGAEEKVRLNSAKILWRDALDAEAHKNAIAVEIAPLLQIHEEAVKEARASEEESKKIQDMKSIEDSITELAAAGEQLNQEEQQAQREYAESLRRVQNVKRNIDELQRALNEQTRRTKSVAKEIEELQAQAKQGAKGDERVLREKITEITNEIQTILAQEAEKRNRASQVQANLQEFSNHVRNTDNNIRSLQNDIRNQQQEKVNLQSQSGGQGRLQQYGNNIPRVLATIQQQMNKFRGPVLGPLGTHISLRADCKHKGAAVERALGGVLNSFIITNRQDEELLRQIFRQLGVKPPMIINQPPEKNTPDGRYRVNTIPAADNLIDAIVVENALVYNCVVDKANLANIVYVDNDDTATVGQYLVTNPNTRKRVFRDGIVQLVTNKGVVVTCKYGNISSVSAMAGSYRRLLSQDVSEIVAHLEESINEKQAQVEAFQKEKVAIDQQWRNVEAEVQDLNKFLNGLRGRQTQLNRSKNTVQSQLDEIIDVVNIDTTALEAELAELSDANRNLSGQIEAKMEEQRHVAATSRQKKDAMTDTQRRMEQLNNEKAEKEQELVNFIDQRETVMRKLRSDQRKADVAGRQVEDVRNRLTVAENEHNRKLELATEQTPKFIENWDGQPVELNSKDTMKNLLKEKNIVAQDLDTRRREVVRQVQGQSLDVLSSRVQKAKKDYEDSKALLDKMAENIANLEQDFGERRAMWKAQRKNCSNKVKKKFNYYMNQKGFSGTCEFNSNEETLVLVAQTDNSNKQTMTKDVKELSGGERSYTTLCLLLALGHAIEAPFRLMDEYDVFLDEMSRKITLDSIMDYALRPEFRNIQFFILTPHALKIVTSKDIRIQSMPEPPRNTARGLQQATIGEVL